MKKKEEKVERTEMSFKSSVKSKDKMRRKSSSSSEKKSKQ